MKLLLHFERGTGRQAVLLQTDCEEQQSLTATPNKYFSTFPQIKLENAFPCHTQILEENLGVQ